MNKIRKNIVQRRIFFLIYYFLSTVPNNLRQLILLINYNF